MSVLSDFTAALAEGRIEVVDLTAPLSHRTPILQLPPPFANTHGFALQEISHYDDRGPGWYWNNFSAGEHVGTHFDAPVHWITGRNGTDVSQVPPRQLIGPAVVIDKSTECATNPDFLLELRMYWSGSVSTVLCRNPVGCSFAPVGTAERMTRLRF